MCLSRISLTPLKFWEEGGFPCCNLDYVNKVVIQYFSYLLFIFMDSTILFKNNGIVIQTFPTTKKWLNGLPECFVRHCVVSTGCYFEKVVFHVDFSELYAFVSLPCKILPVFLRFCSVKPIFKSGSRHDGFSSFLMTLEFIGACLLTTSVYFVTKES